MTQKKKSGELICNNNEIQNYLDRISEDIITNHTQLDEVALVGIQSSGFPLAKRLKNVIQKKTNHSLPVGKFDVTLFRDDFKSRHDFVTIQESDIPFSIANKTVILVDDVLFHGRTIRAALNGLMEFGSSSSIELAVLIDRGIKCREFPIFARYSATTLEIKSSQFIQVKLYEIDGEDGVFILDK